MTSADNAKMATVREACMKAEELRFHLTRRRALLDRAVNKVTITIKSHNFKDNN